MTQYRGTVGVFNNGNFSFNYKGPYIKYAKGGDWRVFVGAIKYFRHILMVHEIFFKIFDRHEIFSYVLFS